MGSLIIFHSDKSPRKAFWLFGLPAGPLWLFKSVFDNVHLTMLDYTMGWLVAHKILLTAQRPAQLLQLWKLCTRTKHQGMYIDGTLPRLNSNCYYTSVHKTCWLYKCTQNQFIVQVYTKPVYCTSVHNQFTVQVYTKPVKIISVHKSSLM